MVKTLADYYSLTVYIGFSFGSLHLSQALIMLPFLAIQLWTFYDNRFILLSFVIVKLYFWFVSVFCLYVTSRTEKLLIYSSKMLDLSRRIEFQCSKQLNRQHTKKKKRKLWMDDDFFLSKHWQKFYILA